MSDSAIIEWPHCPDCLCVAMGHEAFCWRCGAGICQSQADCLEFTDAEGNPLGETCSQVRHSGSTGDPQ